MLNRIWTRATAGVSAAALATGLALAPQVVQAQTAAPVLGQCVKPEVLSAQLKAQQQRTVYEAVADGITKGPGGKDYRLMVGFSFTSNPIGTKGYAVRECFDGVKALGLLKADAEFQAVRMYAPTIQAALPEMLVTASRDVALKACNTTDRATCGFHNDSVAAIYSNKGKIAYQGVTTDNRLMTVNAFSNNTGGLLVTSVSGATTHALTLKDGEYTEYAKSIAYTIPGPSPLAAADLRQVSLR